MSYERPIFALCIFVWAPLAFASPQSLPALARNPFRPVTTPPPPPSREKRPPLEQHPLSALSLTAIVTNMEGELFASVEIPSGIGFKVVRGTILGDARARVLDISKLGIVVEEIVQGTAVKREITLRREE